MKREPCVPSWMISCTKADCRVVELGRSSGSQSILFGRLCVHEEGLVISSSSASRKAVYSFSSRPNLPRRGGSGGIFSIQLFGAACSRCAIQLGVSGRCLKGRGRCSCSEDFY